MHGASRSLSMQILGWLAALSILVAPVTPAWAAGSADSKSNPDQDIGADQAVRYIAMPVTTGDAHLQQQRQQMVVHLVQLGETPEDAIAASLALTADDLDVLLANERMLQPAAGLSQTSIALIIGALIITGIVLLAVAGESSGSISVGGGM